MYYLDLKPLTITLLLLAAGAVSAQSNPPMRMPEHVAIFAVRHDGQTFSVDPVVIVHYGAY